MILRAYAIIDTWKFGFLSNHTVTGVESGVPRILFGLILVTTGRRLYWFFVGVMGFLVGVVYAPIIFPGQTTSMQLIIALVAGFVGAAAALFLQTLMVGLAGFVAGGFILTRILQALAWDTSGYGWIPFVLGGVIGAALIAIIFNWALVVLSSLAGAILVTQNIPASLQIRGLIFVVLLLVGIAVQAATMPREARMPAGT
jgi:hypothetical protein